MEKLISKFHDIYCICTYQYNCSVYCTIEPFRKQMVEADTIIFSSNTVNKLTQVATATN